MRNPFRFISAGTFGTSANQDNIGDVERMDKGRNYESANCVANNFTKIVTSNDKLEKLHAFMHDSHVGMYAQARARATKMYNAEFQRISQMTKSVATGTC